MNIKRYFTLIIAVFVVSNGFSQDAKLDKKIKKLLNAKEIVWDHFNEDGVLKARSKSTGKWGMYQYFYDNKRPKMLVQMKYDSLGFYDEYSSITIVKLRNKYGLLGSPWSDGPAKLIIRCIYQDMRYTSTGDFIAVKANNKWAYLNTENGDTLVPFVHNSFQDLPKPTYYIRENPMSEYPEKLLQLLANPEAVENIDLSGLNLTYIPNSIGKCVNARTANLEKNKLSGLPESFFELEKLEVLQIGGNPGFIKFDSNFAKLKNLRELYIGGLKSYGSFSYSTNSFEFSDKLSKLKNLKKLKIFGHFNDNGDLPQFVYNLPNLTYLKLDGVLGRDYENMDLSKLQCKDSLRQLEIRTIESFANMNESMKLFPKLEKVYVYTFKHHDKPLWINDLKSLKYVRITYYVPSKSSEGYFSDERAATGSGDYYGEKIMTDEERKEALDEYDEFLKKLEED
jgi:hypothetical protein